MHACVCANAYPKGWRLKYLWGERRRHSSTVLTYTVYSNLDLLLVIHTLFAVAHPASPHHLPAYNIT